MFVQVFVFPISLVWIGHLMLLKWRGMKQELKTVAPLPGLYSKWRHWSKMAAPVSQVLWLHFCAVGGSREELNFTVCGLYPAAGSVSEIWAFLEFMWISQSDWASIRESSCQTGVLIQIGTRSKTEPGTRTPYPKHLCRITSYPCSAWTAHFYYFQHTWVLYSHQSVHIYGNVHSRC